MEPEFEKGDVVTYHDVEREILGVYIRPHILVPRGATPCIPIEELETVPAGTFFYEINGPRNEIVPEGDLERLT